jgi:uncharacterized protein
MTIRHLRPPRPKYMDITPLIPQDAKLIQGYGAGGVRVSGDVYHTSIIVQPTRVTPWDGTYQSLQTLTDTEILILGTDQAQPLPADTRAAFRARGIGVEIMDIGAACRTYNVLLTEGRKVAVAILLP